MSILIRDMEMPKSCYRCPMANDDFYLCGATEKYLENDSEERRPDWCTLVEIPTPHGRLIDADKFKADYSMKNDCAECEKELQGSSRACEYDRIYSKMDFCGWLDNAEIAIEAEGETDA